MNKLIPAAKFSAKIGKFMPLDEVSVITDEKKNPRGFVFGRDAFISFLEQIDAKFEEKISDPKVAFDNPAGKLIDLIEEKLPVNPKFIQELKNSIKQTGANDWIPLSEISRFLNV